MLSKLLSMLWQTVKFGPVLTPIIGVIIGLGLGVPLFFSFHLTSAQTNTSGAGNNLSTPLEELQSQNFALITVNSEQIQELRSTVNHTNQAIEKGNLTEALNHLRVLDQQLQLLSERASPFGG